MTKTMLILMMLLAVLAPQFVLSTASQSSLPIAQAEFGTIQGTIVREGTSDPIPDVQIIVNRMGSATAFMDARQAQSLIDATARGSNIPAEALQTARDVLAGRAPAPITAVSDSDGRFEFKNVPAGEHVVRAQLQGYFGPPVSGFTTASVSTTVTVSAQKAAAPRLSLIPGGTINGRVVDSAGKPLSDARVQVLRTGYTEGIPTLEPVNMRPTDDRGEFRMFRLPPGEYYLMANVRRTNGSATREMPVATLYPSAREVSAAVPIKLQAGDELFGMNIQVKTAVGVRVSGKVTSTLPAGPITGNNGQARPSIASLTLMPRDSVGLPDISVDSVSANPDTGDFEFQNVLPGSYDVFARLPTIAHGGWGGAAPPAFAQNPWGFGRTSIEVVNGQNIENISVVVHTGVDVKGRVTVDGNPWAANVTVSMVPDDNADKTNDIPMSNVMGNITRFRPTIDRDGAFTFPLLPEGRYRFQVDLATAAAAVPRLPANAYIADIRQGGVSVYDNGIAVGREPGGIVDVAINGNGGSITATVFGDDRKPASGATVVVVPARHRRQNRDLYKMGSSNGAGQLTITDIAPGEYTVFAWENVPRGAYQNAEFLMRYEGRGTPVNVSAGMRTIANVSLIPNGK